MQKMKKKVSYTLHDGYLRHPTDLSKVIPFEHVYRVIAGEGHTCYFFDKDKTAKKICDCIGHVLHRFANMETVRYQDNGFVLMPAIKCVYQNLTKRRTVKFEMIDGTVLETSVRKTPAFIRTYEDYLRRKELAKKTEEKESNDLK